ncbi:hypothetical protein BH11PLA1_BH11PLA1_15380 [soil metagenome]
MRMNAMRMVGVAGVVALLAGGMMAWGTPTGVMGRAAEERKPTGGAGAEGMTRDGEGAKVDARAAVMGLGDEDELALTRGVMLRATGAGGRQAINRDPFSYALTRPEGAGFLERAAAGETISVPVAEGEKKVERTWRAVEADKDGALAGGKEVGEMRGGDWVLCTVESKSTRVMILEANGHGMVYVNGSPHAGDPYGNGTLAVPVKINAGRNTLLFAHAGRGGLMAKVVRPGADVIVRAVDMTLPDFVGAEDGDGGEGTKAAAWMRATVGPLRAGFVVINATERQIAVRLEQVGGAMGAADSAAARTVEMAPLGVTKIRGWIDAARGEDGKSVALRAGGKVEGEMTARVMARVTDSSDPKKKFGALTEFEGTVKNAKFSCAVVGGAARRKITYESAVDGSVQYASVVPPRDLRVERVVLSLHGASVEATSQAAAYAPSAGTLIVCATNRRPFGFDWEDWGRVDALEALSAAWRKFEVPERAPCALTGHSMGGHGTWNIAVQHPEVFDAVLPSAGWLSFETYGGARGERDAKKHPAAEACARATAWSDTPRWMERLRGKAIYILHGDADDNVPVSEARRAGEILTGLGIPFQMHEQAGAGHWWDGDASEGADCLQWPGLWAVVEGMTRNEEARPVMEEVKRALGDGPVVVYEEERGAVARGFKNVFSRRFVLVYRDEPEGGKLSTLEARSARARFDAEQWLYRGNGCAEIITETRAFWDADAYRGRNMVCYGIRPEGALFGPVGGLEEGFKSSGESLQTVRPWFRTSGGMLLALPDVSASSGPRMVGLVNGIDRMPYFLAGVGVPQMMGVSEDVLLRGWDGVTVAGEHSGMGPFFHAWYERREKKDEGAATPKP